MRELPNIPVPRALERHPAREVVIACIRAALAAAQPEACIARQVHLAADRFLLVGERPFDLADYGRVRIFGAGKASEGMTRALVQMLGDRISDGLVIVKHPSIERIGPVEIRAGDHPTPGDASVATTRALLEALADVRPDDLVLAPISGGASTLLCTPDEFSVHEIAAINERLLRCGADIEGVNAIRKLVDPIKAGGLAAAAGPAFVIGLVLSDVPGDQSHLVGSGPTVPHRAEAVVREARQAAARWLGPDDTWTRRLEATSREVTELGIDQVHNVVVGGNADAATAAASAAQTLGYAGSTMSSPLVGEAAEAGRGLARLLAEAPEGWPLPPPACLVAGGETTVTLNGDSIGRGGRTLELALAAIDVLADRPDRVLVTLATDGDDGNSGAAGAIVTGETAKRVRALGLDPGRAAAEHDSASIFDALGDTLRTGPTGTNVCDLALLFAASGLAR